jgi:hypothetical protein
MPFAYPRFANPQRCLDRWVRLNPVPSLDAQRSALVRRATLSLAVLVAGCLMVGCQSLTPPRQQPLGPRLDASIKAMISAKGNAGLRAQTESDHRALLAANLPELLAASSISPLMHEAEGREGVYQSKEFARLTPVLRSQSSVPGLERSGLGLPMVGAIQPGGPHAPRDGFQVPLTLIALPEHAGVDCCKAALVDPRRIDRVRTEHGKLPVSMDLDAALSATSATGPRLGVGLFNLIRPGAFAGRPRIVFLQPFDPDKVPVVLIHGLLSTPQAWAPLVRALLADSHIRQHCQLWFFYYPNGQPVPLSALQLREALDDAVSRYPPRKSMVLIGHSMGGILARVQVSRVTLEQAKSEVYNIASLPEYSQVRRALVFEPRRDVDRAVFMFTPHRGSRLADSRMGAFGLWLIRLPSLLLDELEAASDFMRGIHGDWFPPSIRGLSPSSQFLQVLDSTSPAVPTHTILGDRGRGNGVAGSDGVVAYRSATLPAAESEVIVPAGHGGFAHPEAISELKRILRLAIRDDEKHSGRSLLLDRPAVNPFTVSPRCRAY